MFTDAPALIYRRHAPTPSYKVLLYLVLTAPCMKR